MAFEDFSLLLPITLAILTATVKRLDQLGELKRVQSLTPIRFFISSLYFGFATWSVILYLGWVFFGWVQLLTLAVTWGIALRIFEKLKHADFLWGIYNVSLYITFLIEMMLFVTKWEDIKAFFSSLF